MKYESNHAITEYRKRKYDKCSIEGCSGKGWVRPNGREMFKRGYCLKHYTEIVDTKNSERSRTAYESKYRKEAMAELRIGYWQNMAYSNLKRRVKTEEAKNLTEEHYLPSREEFYSVVAENEEKLRSMWRAYRDSGFNSKLSISVDRIDNGRGYHADNIQFITRSDNVKKAWSDKAYIRSK